MSLSNRARIILGVICVILCMACISHICRAEVNCLDAPKVLFVGFELEDLALQERNRFANYKIIVRPHLPGEMVKTIVQQVQPKAVLIKQSSGKIYEYSSNGTLMKEIASQNSQYKFFERQQNHLTNLPQTIQSIPQTGFTQKNTTSLASHYSLPQPNTHQHNSIPVQINGQMTFPANQHSWQVQPQTLINQHYPKQTLKTQTIQAQTYPHFVAPQLQPSSQYKPFPGAEVPTAWHPGNSYSYLPGEGEYLPPPGSSLGRQALRQLSGLAQNISYPFWFDSYLTTNTNTLNGFSTDVGTNGGFPSLQFDANTTANANVVAGQFIGTTLGLGATTLNALLDGRDLKERRQRAYQDSLGTPYYQYPEYAYSRYPAIPYRPVPSVPWFD